LSVLLASQEAERKRSERDEGQKARGMEDRIAAVERLAQTLQYAKSGHEA